MDELDQRLAATQAELADVEADIQRLQDVHRALKQRIKILKREIFWRDNPGERLEIGEELVKSEAFYQLMAEYGYTRRQVDEWYYKNIRVSYCSVDLGVGVEATTIRNAVGSISVPLDVARTMKKAVNEAGA